jgi:hypothetical protein
LVGGDGEVEFSEIASCPLRKFAQKKASPRAGEGLRKKTNVKCTPEDFLH